MGTALKDADDSEEELVACSACAMFPLLDLNRRYMPESL